MLIPSINVEIENIFQYTEALGSKSIALCSANSKEGVSTAAQALSQRFMLAGLSTLVIDLNLYRPTLHLALPPSEEVVSNFFHSKPSLVQYAGNSATLIGKEAPKDLATIIELRKPGILEKCIEYWHQDFQRIIFDTSPINKINAHNIPPERVARACDATFMIIQAGVTKQTDLKQAVDHLKKHNVQLTASIINDQYNPSLKMEMIRECRRLPPVLGKLSNRLRNWIHQNHYLSLSNL